MGGSSSRVFRASLILRAVAALICAAAFPGNPLALPILLVGSALFSGAGNAGALAANERLYRLAPAEMRVRCQSYYISRTSVAFAAGAGTCAIVLSLSGPIGWTAYTALFLGSGVCRSLAAWRTEVTATWQSPIVPDI
jgi:MFS family permease